MPSDGRKYYQGYKRNWAEYNEQLVRRGELYLNIDWLDSWDDELRMMNEGKRGHPYQFPESMMRFLAGIRQLLRMCYRQMEGFLRSLSTIVGFKVADYTTIWHRISSMNIDIKVPRTNGPVVIAVDSTGMKVTTRGEWLREKHHRRRGWIKVHLSVDVDGGPVSIEVTDERVGDSRIFPALIESAENALGEGVIVEALADGAYDTRRNFQLLDEKGIGAGIRIRKGATRRSRGSSARPKAVRELNTLGYDGWREKHGYGRRWAAEWTFSAVKRIFGESVMAKRRDLMFKEVRMKFALYSILLQIGS